MKAQLRTIIKSRYGISLKQAKNIWKTPCEICGLQPQANRFKKSNIDHDKKTTKIRGALCDNCNHGLGQFKHNKKILQKAIKYLSKNRFMETAPRCECGRKHLRTELKWKAHIRRTDTGSWKAHIRSKV